MKLLPCSSEACRPRGGFALDRSGMAYYAERYPGRPGMALRYVCGGCGRLVEITAEGYAALPEAHTRDLQSAGVLDHVAKDLRVAAGLAGVTPAQADDLFEAGIRTAQDLTDLFRPQEEIPE